MILWQKCQKGWSLLASHVHKALAEDWMSQAYLLSCPLRDKTHCEGKVHMFNFFFWRFGNSKNTDDLPLIPDFQTVLVYLRPDTMLLLAWKENFKLYLLPSFNVNHKPLGFPSSGIGRTMSDLPGETIDRLRIFTSGSRVSAIEDTYNKNFTARRGEKKLHFLSLLKKEIR